MPVLDTRIITRVGTYIVLAQRHEIMFADGLAVSLHPVVQEGEQPDESCVHPYLRALQLEGLHWTLLNLRHLSPDLHARLPNAPKPKHPGLVFNTLRTLYATRAAFLNDVPCLSLRAWWPPANPNAAEAA